MGPGGFSEKILHPQELGGGKKFPRHRSTRSGGGNEPTSNLGKGTKKNREKTNNEGGREKVTKLPNICDPVSKRGRTTLW